jgi:DNA-binding transcriptional MocR family regulator
MAHWTPKIGKLGRRAAPLYLAIVDALADDIASGRLLPGERIPAQRVLAAELGIDFTTVSRAYTEARRRGLVSGHPGRGTFVRDSSVERARAGAEQFIDLSLNVPADLTDNTVERELAMTLDSISGHADLSRFIRYGSESQGALDHREAGTLWIQDHGLSAPAERIAICSGAQHSIAVILASLGVSGRAILSEGLTFPAMKPLARYLNSQLVGVATDDDGILPDALAKACRDHKPVALCTVPTLQNPTATVMPDARRREIAAVAREYGLIILEDDAYGAIPENAPAPLSSYAPELSYYVASLSKSTTPGLRVAYSLAPDERSAARIANATRTTIWMVAPLLTEIAARWIRDGTARRIVHARQAEATARNRIATDTLGRHLTNAHHRGYHAWLRLPDRWSSAGFVNEARRRGVAVLASDAFAVDPSFLTPAVRVCYGSPASRTDLTKGLRILAGMLDSDPNSGTVLL